MTDIIERYIHQVGRYLPTKEREEIQVELRSQIRDQLEDRFDGTASAEDVRTMLIELGDPRQLAASYGSQQYLIGPNLYPVMMSVLRSGWALVPIIVIIVHAVLALFSTGDESLVSLFLGAVFGVIQALLIFTGVVVALFVILEHSGEDIGEITGQDKVFNPDDLPEVDQPGGVDRFEAAFGIAFYILLTLVLLYFVSAGGITTRLNLTEPGPVIPAPIPWLVALIVATVGELGLTLLAIRRGRWTVGTQALQTVLELFGGVAVYFAIIRPLFEFGLRMLPDLSAIPFIERFPEMFLVFSLVIVLVTGVVKIVKLLVNPRRV